ncbi:MAG: two component LuxR family transcriptional regulator, partial [uncultured bacterium]
MNKTKIVIIDDHPLLRQGLAQMINQEADMIFAGEAGDATEAMQIIAKIKPDLVIADINLKGMSGIELTKNIIARDPKILVLIISMYDESLYVERVLRAGAKGYLMKQEATYHAITAIRKVLNGEIYVSDKWRDSLVNKFINSNNSTSGPSTERLSDREREVLHIM